MERVTSAPRSSRRSGGAATSRSCSRDTPHHPRRRRLPSPATCATATRCSPPRAESTPSATPPRSSASGSAIRSEFDRVNVGGLEAVIDVCRTLHIPRLVYTSSFLALPPAGRTRCTRGERLSAIEGASARGRTLAAARGVPVVTLVPGVVYGPGPATDGNLVGRMTSDHLAGRLPGVVGADRVWSFTYIDDVAEAHVTAVERGDAGEEYLVGGENVPQMRLFDLLRETTGTPLPRRIPKPAAWIAGMVRRAPSPDAAAPTDPRDGKNSRPRLACRQWS